MKFTQLFLIIAFLSASAIGQTNFQGGIYNDTKWTKNNSP